MTHYQLPYLGNIPLQATEFCYEAQMPFQDRTINISLFPPDNKIFDVKTLEKIKSIIERAGELNKHFKERLREDYDDEDADNVKLYITHHLEECSEDELATLINYKNGNLEEQLLDKLDWVSVSFFPGSEDIGFFDYSIGEELTQYKVAVYINDNGGVTDITMES
jgi:hypothetical protein